MIFYQSIQEITKLLVIRFQNFGAINWVIFNQSLLMKLINTNF